MVRLQNISFLTTIDKMMKNGHCNEMMISAIWLHLFNSDQSRS